MNPTTPTAIIPSSSEADERFVKALRQSGPTGDRRSFVRAIGMGAMGCALPGAFAEQDEKAKPVPPGKAETADIDSISQSVFDYLLRCQDFTPGEYYGSFWSEKGYHGPLLDYDAGGSHHHRAAGSGGLALWLLGLKRNDSELKHRAELAFDWLAARQQPSGGFLEIQNNEVPSDWEYTGLEESSTISTGFAAHGMGHALLLGLPPKKLYSECMQKAGHWQLSIEWPPGSGIFPHHQRSPHDTLNANLHAAETFMAGFKTSQTIFKRPLNIFYQAAKRSVLHTLSCQMPNGCFPYRTSGGVTINYTSLVVWCLLNILDLLDKPMRPGLGHSIDLKASADRFNVFAPTADLQTALTRATTFLCSCIDSDGNLLWEKNETSSAKYNMWTYAITYNVLMRVAGDQNTEAAGRLLKTMLSKRTKSGLLPMRDRGDEVTECAFMQADMLLFLLPFSDLV